MKRTFLRNGFATAVISLFLFEMPLIASAPSPARRDQPEGENRALHALNRLTFGPLPGEAAEVNRIGLKRWFDMQLNPQTIDDSALDTRLALFPAMALTQRDLLDRYPSPQRLRMILKRDDQLPPDPVEHAIYADSLAFYQEAQARKAAAKIEGEPATEAKIPAVDQDEDLETASEAPRADSGARAFPPAERAQILALPPKARFQRILALPPAELVRFRRSLSRPELAALTGDLTPQQREIFSALQGPARMISRELLQARLERDIYSKRQIEAVMTDFWLNHFNVYLRKNQNEPYLLPAYERETIRPHALGRFEELLVATAESPAMLVYLDNWESIGPDSQAAHHSAAMHDRGNASGKPAAGQPNRDRGLNENYARELLELHTLGIACEVSKDHTAAELNPACGSGYTQSDVIALAKVFSGWTVDRPAEGGEFQFDPRRHEPGAKSIFGQTLLESGQKEGLEVLHTLAISPATARLLSTQLAVRFVSDTPPPALVDRMTKSYLASGGEIRSVLRTMFNSPEFWAPGVYRVKLKTPLEFVTSAMRATRTETTSSLPAVQALDRLGMPLYGMQTPNGYSWMSEAWVSTGALVSRMNFALMLTSGMLPGAYVDESLLFGDRPGQAQVATLITTSVSSSKLVDADERRLESLLLGSPATERTRQAVLAQAVQPFPSFGPPKSVSSPPDGSLPAPTQEPPKAAEQSATMAGLLLGSPEFQRH